MGTESNIEEGNIVHPTGTVTFLFTDIVDSTRLWERYPQMMSRCLEKHDELFASICLVKGGHIFKHVGDALCIAFQRATNAVQTSIVGQFLLESELDSDPCSIKVRMAIHSGECQERRGDYFGPAVNRIARILDLATGGQILLSNASRELLGDQLPDGVTLKDLGIHKLRDLGRPEHIFQLNVPRLNSEFPPLKSIDYYPNNLPSQLTAFIGRENELVELHNLMTTARLITLTGPGGTGKTRLALQAAVARLEDFQDGVFFTSLEGLTDSNIVGRKIATDLGVELKGNVEPSQALIDNLRDKRLLLIVDNFEHVLDASSLIAELLKRTNLLHILVTSREALNIYGEQEFLVPTLALPPILAETSYEMVTQSESTVLLIDRIRSVKVDFRPTSQNAKLLAEICRQLDGLPLAIELAAARAKIFPLPALFSQLQKSLGLLGGGPRDVPSRHQTLYDAINWSYELLSRDEQKLFRYFSVFRGGASLEALEIICGDLLEMPVIEIICSLVDKNLIRSDEMNGSVPRFTMLSTIRTFALDKLSVEREVDDIKSRHLAYFLKLAQESSPNLQRGFETSYWNQLLSAELDNIQAALKWALTDEAADEAVGNSAVLLAGNLRHFWFIRGMLTEGRRWLDLAVERTGVDPFARGLASEGLGLLAWQQGDYGESTSHLETAVEIFRELGESSGLAEAYHWLGHLMFDRKEYLTAREYFGSSLAIYQEMGSDIEQVVLRKDMGLVAYHEGDYEGAYLRFTDCLEYYLEQDNKENAADVLLNLGDLARLAGDLDLANAHYDEALRIFEEIGASLGIASCHHKLGQVFCRRGELSRADAFFNNSLAMQQEFGNKQGIAECLAAKAGLALAAGQLERATQLLSAVNKYMNQLGAPLAPADRLELEHVEQILRKDMTPDQYEQHWQLGRSLPIESILDMTPGSSQ